MNPTQNQTWEDLVIREPEAKPAPAARVPSPAPAPQAAALPLAPFAVKPAARTSHQVQAAYLTHELRAPVTSIRLGLSAERPRRHLRE